MLWLLGGLPCGRRVPSQGTGHERCPCCPQGCPRASRATKADSNARLPGAQRPGQRPAPHHAPIHKGHPQAADQAARQPHHLAGVDAAAGAQRALVLVHAGQSHACSRRRHSMGQSAAWEPLPQLPVARSTAKEEGSVRWTLSAALADPSPCTEPASLVHQPLRQARLRGWGVHIRAQRFGCTQTHMFSVTYVHIFTSSHPKDIHTLIPAHHTQHTSHTHVTHTHTHMGHLILTTHCAHSICAQLVTQDQCGSTCEPKPEYKAYTHEHHRTHGHPPAPCRVHIMEQHLCSPILLRAAWTGQGRHEAAQMSGPRVTWTPGPWRCPH